jgi:hypothetical protein
MSTVHNTVLYTTIQSVFECHLCFIEANKASFVMFKRSLDFRLNTIM